MSKPATAPARRPHPLAKPARRRLEAGDFIGGGMIAVFFLAFLLTVYYKGIKPAIYEHKHPCIRSHVAKIWIPPQSSPMIVDGEGTTVDYESPGHYAEETVCDERENGPIKIREQAK